MNLHISLLILLFFCALSLFANPPTEKDCDYLLEIGDARRQVGDFADQLYDSVKRQGMVLDQDLQIRFDDLVARVYSEEALYPVFRQAFCESLPPEHLAECIAFQGSPLGRKVTELEAASGEGDVNARFQEYMPKVLALPEERKELIRGYLKLTGAEQNIPRLVTSPLRELMYRMQPLLPPERQMNDQQLKTVVSAMEAQAVMQFRNLLPASTAFVYQDLKNEELAKMMDFFRTPAGEAFVEANWAGLGAALKNAAGELARGIAEIAE